jgi:hypothetical protein
MKWGLGGEATYRMLILKTIIIYNRAWSDPENDSEKKYFFIDHLIKIILQYSFISYIREMQNLQNEYFN